MSQSAGERFQQLVDIIRALRSPQGCPWDREQTLRSLRPFVLEETYELLDALDRGDHDGLRQEIGDFVLEAVFLSQICDEEGRFSIADAIQAIIDKLVRRHPHVDFTGVLPGVSHGGLHGGLHGSSHGGAQDGSHDGSTGRLRTGALHEGPREGSSAPLPTTAGEVKERWEDIKARERRAAGDAHKSVLSGVPRAMPSLLRAYELSTRAATVGFDWVKADQVLDKIDEEARELRAAVAANGAHSSHAEEELGDLFFALANLARKLGVEPEAALRVANDKFQRRFDEMERAATGEGRRLKDLTVDELEARWQMAKTRTTQNTATKDTKT